MVRKTLSNLVRKFSSCKSIRPNKLHKHVDEQISLDSLTTVTDQLDSKIPAADDDSTRPVGSRLRKRVSNLFKKLQQLKKVSSTNTTLSSYLSTTSKDIVEKNPNYYFGPIQTQHVRSLINKWEGVLNSSECVSKKQEPIIIRLYDFNSLKEKFHRSV